MKYYLSTRVVQIQHVPVFQTRSPGVPWDLVVFWLICESARLYFLGYRTCRVAGFVPCMPWYALLVRTWACYSESGQPRPRTEQRVNVRNRRPTCETAGSHAGHVGTQVAVAHSQSMTDHGAATHRPAMQHSQERGKHHHLQQRLSRAAQPTSHPASNTICPSS